MRLLESVRNVLLDVDGVLCEGDHPLPGAIHFLNFLDGQNIDYACVTNSAALTPEQRAAKLNAQGFSIPSSRIITSALAARKYLDSQVEAGTRIFAIGMEGLRDALFGDGTYTETADLPEVVVVSHDEHLTYNMCSVAAQALQNGALFIATNPDVTIPSPGGLIPETGALIAYLEAATGVRARVVGKPQPELFHYALQQSGASGSTLVIGDRLDTDIAGAHAAGLEGVLVLTGVTSKQMLSASAHQPDAVFDDLPSLMMAWQHALADQPQLEDS